MDESEKKSRLGGGLLSQESAKNLDQQYRKEVEKMLEKETKQMRLIVWANIIAFLLLVIGGVVLSFIGQSSHWEIRRIAWMGTGFLCFVLAGMIGSQMVSLRVRFDLMKEIKELRLELHELAKKLGHDL